MGYEKANKTEEFNERNERNEKNERNEYSNNHNCQCSGKLCEALRELEEFAEFLCKKCCYEETHLLIELKEKKNCVKVDIEVHE